jgi:hypothetical protein
VVGGGRARPALRGPIRGRRRSPRAGAGPKNDRRPRRPERVRAGSRRLVLPPPAGQVLARDAAVSNGDGAILTARHG